MYESVFSININDLKSLDQDRAVEFFRRVLWAEASKVDLSRHLVEVPDCINVGDGGIDARIDDANHADSSFIPHGTTGFQIKAGSLTESQVKKELHEGSDTKKPLKPGIVRLLSSGGTYILVLFASLSDKQKQKRIDAIKNELASSYPSAKVDVITVTQLAGIAEQFPSMSAWLGKHSEYCLSYEGWSGRDDVRNPSHFVPDKEREATIESIQNEIRSAEEKSPVIRVMGLPGIGKTRTVLEALSPSDIRNRVIYVFAENFVGTPLQKRLEAEDSLYAIVVVEDCNISRHQELVRAFSSRGNRLALITLSHDFDKAPEPARVQTITGLERDAMKDMISKEFPALFPEVVDRLAVFADGYPRIGYLLGQSYSSSETKSSDFVALTDDDLIQRLIAGREDINGSNAQMAKKVLTGLSLFTKIGYKDGPEKEIQWLASYLKVDISDLKRIVSEQKKRGIVQGEYFIFVTPFMLRVSLLSDWWNSEGFTSTSFQVFADSIPEESRESMLRRFSENIPFINTTPQGRDFAKELLGKNGIFADGTLLETEFGAGFFFKLTDADPESALRCLQRTVGTWSHEKLLHFVTGRRDIVWALEKIVIWDDYFEEGSDLLLKLATAENESVSNNSTGTYADLFSPAPGRVSSTEADLEKRITVLERVMKDSSREVLLVGIKACERALETDNFMRTVGAEHQGLRKQPQLWTPKSNSEFRTYFEKVWALLYVQAFGLDAELKVAATKAMLNQAHGLIGWIPDLVLTSLDELAQSSDDIKNEILQRLIRILRYAKNRIDPEVKAKVEGLKNKLSGDDFPSRLKRYVGMSLLEDEYDEDGERSTTADDNLNRLAQESIDNPDLLGANLDWLTTNNLSGGHTFGYRLGKLDKNHSFLPSIHISIKKNTDKATDTLLGGYLSALAEDEPEKKEAFLEELANDQELVRLVPTLVWRSGVTDRAARLVTTMARDGKIDESAFPLFALGSAIRNLSESVFIEWLELLLKIGNPRSIFTALDLVHFYYLRKESKQPLPLYPVLELLTHDCIYKPTSEKMLSQMDDHNWTDVGIKIQELYPEIAVELGSKVLGSLGGEGTIFGEYNSQTLSVANEASKKEPDAMWQIVSQLLGPPLSENAYRVKGWLHGSRHSPEGSTGGLAYFSPEEVFGWVDEDIEKRAWYIADFAPKLLFKEEGKVCWAREVLVRYGERKDVRQTLSANFWSEGFFGPASKHYQSKIDSLKEFRKDETDKKVIAWLDEYIDSLEDDVKKGKIDEEYRGF